MTTALPDPAASRALLIGVHAYASLPALPAVERNLAGLKRAFTDEALWGLPDTHCRVLPQPESAEAVLDTLHSVALEATDTLVVYYAGHGLTDPYSDELFLALPASDQKRMYRALPYEWVRRAILDPRVRARRKVVILDCCYSGRALLGGMSGTDQVADRALIEGTCLMAAAAETRTALSPPGEEFTAFTGELITALAEGIPDGPPLLDMHTLFRHLHTNLAAKARPLPQQRNRNTGGSIALARNRVHLREEPVLETDSAPSPSPSPPPVPGPSPGTTPAQTSAPTPAPVPTPAPAPAPAPAEPPTTKSDAPAGARPDRRAPVVDRPAPPDRSGTRRVPAATPSSAPPKETGRPQLRIGLAAALAVLLAAGIPAVLNWLPDGSGESGGSGAKYNAATKGVVNASRATGGTLKFAGPEPDSWDPQRSYYGAVWNFARYYTRQLVTYAPKPGSQGTELTPDLATDRAKVSHGGKTYTYTLRKGLTWQDGSALTSKDIKYGIERLWAQDVVSGGPNYLQQALDPGRTYKGPYKDTSRDKLGLDAIQTPDSRTIVFRLPKPNGEFEHLLAMVAASPVKPGKDTAAKYGNAPFSSGPYIFRSYAPNKSLELVRNPHWHQSSDPIRSALPDKITVDFLTSAAALDADLLAGGHDLAFGGAGLGPRARAQALQDATRRNNLDTPLTGLVRYAAFPRSVAPMDNEHCRKAVVYAADRRALHTAFGGATGSEIAPAMLPPQLAGSDLSYDPYGVRKNDGRPDVDKAEEELKACGRPKGFTTHMLVRSDMPEELAAAKALQEALQKVGIKTRIDQLDGVEKIERAGSPAAVRKNGYGIVLGNWGADFPTGQAFWQPLVDSRFITSSGNYNVSGVDDPRIDKALDSAAAAARPESAAPLYSQISRMVGEGAYYLPFVYERNVTWRSPRLTNVYTSDAYGGYDFARLGVKES
ncbi:ABC transporter substrate-binding protein [Streptomyces sp. NPDC058989]|uniref:caspase, EACC1-associated type n=1 Tax=Streptomyces sp. NPDC058989 TaxID=3346686 RepID=UPI003680C87F